MDFGLVLQTDPPAGLVLESTGGPAKVVPPAELDRLADDTGAFWSESSKPLTEALRFLRHRAINATSDWISSLSPSHCKVSASE